MDSVNALYLALVSKWYDTTALLLKRRMLQYRLHSPSLPPSAPVSNYLKIQVFWEAELFAGCGLLRCEISSHLRLQR
jgi:hypothetical protein